MDLCNGCSHTLNGQMGFLFLGLKEFFPRLSTPDLEYGVLSFTQLGIYGINIRTVL